MKKIIWLLPLALIAACTNKTIAPNKQFAVQYPETRKDSTVDNYFGTQVADPYRWLENDTSAETHNWVLAENKVTYNYLDSIPYRSKLKDRLTELSNYPRQTAPGKVGDYYFYNNNDGLQNQSVLMYKKGIDGTPMVFLDPNAMNAKGTSNISLLGASNDKQYMAYSVAQAGSDWQNIYVKKLDGNVQLNDTLAWTKFSGAAWVGDGFYYSAYAKPKAGEELSGLSQFQKVYWHKLGTPQSKDVIEYEDKANALRYYGAQTTEDERYIFINISTGTDGSEILYKDLKAGDKTYKTLFPGFKYNYNVLDDEGDNLIVMTNDGADNYRVVSVDPKNPSPDKWVNLIPERKELLESVSMAGGKMFAFYLQDVTHHVYQYTRDGKMEHEVKLPGLGVVSGFAGEKNDVDVYYSFESFAIASDIYKYDIGSGNSTMYKKSEVKFNSDDYETKQVFYPSKDGTKIPMFLTYKKGMKLDGTNPTLLYGYGGFSIPVKPSFNPRRVALLENGFIYAVANIRGGLEYGETWHKAGMLLNKQNVFDDFISAAEYLIKEKYTDTSKLAIMGRSNGGLLVGACMTQRPELFRVALPGVGVQDMLRFHKFTVGWGWVTEYGSSDDSINFKNLYSFSPLHNVHAGTNYPCTFITTADHDDRVVPAHSFKFAATLQTAQQGENPILIRIDTDAGHGGGKPLSKQIDEDADWMSFTMWNLGIQNLVNSK